MKGFFVALAVFIAFTYGCAPKPTFGEQIAFESANHVPGYYSIVLNTEPFEDQLRIANLDSLSFYGTGGRPSLAEIESRNYQTVRRQLDDCCRIGDKLNGKWENQRGLTSYGIKVDAIQLTNDDVARLREAAIVRQLLPLNR
ncbi:hypothetical protein FUA23_05350 [Neolewinella aurantiaca]|uniref:Lipoprotein n=1 Tax=Neolewinella aurantiaca TaxID=2602767 RepID=A0A5C7FH10_9BACT|nr:hypothetical protein [Neolewinella aurantiaca]TXF90526.1 hypothetical protein FUA23_05350 [Neolewinella aurantiaca]